MKKPAAGYVDSFCFWLPIICFLCVALYALVTLPWQLTLGMAAGTLANFGEEK